jgi:hypothetical protein
MNTAISDPNTASVLRGIKPITGSAFGFQSTEQGLDWSLACARFTAAQWQAKIEEMAEIGIDTVLLTATARYYRAFFDTSIFPKWRLACDDPLEAVLSAADRCKVKFFIGAGFYGLLDDDKTISDPAAQKQRLQSLGELAARYGHHPSFHGWYWPDEARIDPYYRPEYIAYVNELSKEARRLTPNAPIMIAPYGTRLAKPDAAYVKQLDELDVDIVAYQDEVGVRKSTPAETPAFYEGLRKAHDRSQKARLWADVEVFDFEGPVYQSALVPARFERVARQLESVSPFVDKIIVFLYLGMMNKPGSAAFAGSPASTKLYTDYRNWLNTQKG